MAATVSVVLPVYNRAKSLRAACESVLSQSYRDIELIVVDDGSSEDMKPVIDALDDDRVRFIRRDANGGAAQARNTGLAAARGQFIAFQDSDDLWLPGKLERQMNMLESLPAEVGAVIGSKILYGRDSAYNYGSGKATCAPDPATAMRLDEDQVLKLLRGNRISLQNAVFRCDCMPDIEWFDPCIKGDEDWEFATRLAQHTKIYEDIEPVVVAFISGDSISRNFRKKSLGLLRILKKNRTLLETNPDVYARNLLQLAQMMLRLGKKRLALRLAVAATRQHPMTGLRALSSKGLRLGRLARRMLGSAKVSDTRI